MTKNSKVQENTLKKISPLKLKKKKVKRKVFSCPVFQLPASFHKQPINYMSFEFLFLSFCFLFLFLLVLGFEVRTLHLLGRPLSHKPYLLPYGMSFLCVYFSLCLSLLSLIDLPLYLTPPFKNK
jgi:hypothetical protein